MTDIAKNSYGDEGVSMAFPSRLFPGTHRGAGRIAQCFASTACGAFGRQAVAAILLHSGRKESVRAAYHGA